MYKTQNFSGCNHFLIVVITRDVAIIKAFYM